jgi:dienelactone hydrolase
VTSPAEDIALGIVDLARVGRFEAIRDYFTEALKPLVAPSALKAAWDAEVAQHGPLTSVGEPTSEEAQPGMTVVTVPLAFERGALTLTVPVTGSGQLAGLTLAPADPDQSPWQPPEYAAPALFEEQDLVIEAAGALAVPGTLSLPRAASSIPGVVLLSGSGPEDRDGTIAKSKPLADLAWGLASRGIAVLRFDKVTFAHPEDVKADLDFTVADEYLPHALAAIQQLRNHPAIDHRRVFLAGHSLGGTVAPRVAAAEPSLAGLVILAGGTEPLQWAIVRQFRYIAALAPVAPGESGSMVDVVTAQAEHVDSPDLSPETPASELPFGVPAPYWLDLRSYDPVATAAALGKPILICQGGRDYQATVEGDLARWRAGLDGDPGVTVRVYPPDNHFFFPGTGLSSPAELAPPQHVDPAVVTDIADWIDRIQPAD